MASSHHQAVETAGRGLRVVATSEDGLIEAMEVEDRRFALLVQWHPERMSEEHYRAMFGALVDACKQQERQK